MSHLCRLGEYIDLTFRLSHHTGSSGQSRGLQQGPNSPCDPGLVKFCGTGLCYSGDSYDKAHHKCNKGGSDRCPVDTLGKCPGGLSPDSSMGNSYNRRW